MSGNDPDERARVAQIVDRLCDRFEDGLRTSTPFPVGDALAEAPEEIRPRLFRNLLEIERDYRQKAEKPIGADEARDRFAGFGPWAAAIVDDLFPAEPTLILDVIHGPYAGRSIPLAGHTTFTVGRQLGQHISLPEDAYLPTA
jgi:hypothetical protein